MAEAVAAVAQAVAVAAICSTAIFFYYKLKYLIPYSGAAGAACLWGLVTRSVDPLLAVGGGLGLAILVFPGLELIYGDKQGGTAIDINQAYAAIAGGTGMFLAGVGAGVGHSVGKNNLVLAAIGAGVGYYVGKHYGANAAFNLWIGLGMSTGSARVCNPNNPHEDYSQCVSQCTPGNYKKAYDACMQQTDPSAVEYCARLAKYDTTCPSFLKGAYPGPYVPPPVKSGPKDPECAQYKPYMMKTDPSFSEMKCTLLTGQYGSFEPWQLWPSTWKPREAITWSTLRPVLGPDNLPGPSLDRSNPPSWVTPQDGVMKNMTGFPLLCAQVQKTDDGYNYFLSEPPPGGAISGPRIGINWQAIDVPIFPSGRACAAVAEGNNQLHGVQSLPTVQDAPKFCGAYDKDAQKVGTYNVARMVAITENNKWTKFSCDTGKGLLPAAGPLPWPKK